MRKRLSVLLILLLSIIAVNSIVSFTLAAEVEDAVLEYDAGGVVLPLIKTSEGVTYKVEVFEYSDTEYKDAISSGAVFYPQNLGSYRLRYTIKESGSTSYAYSVIRVEDNTKPVIKLSLKDEYSVGEAVNLIPEIKDNTAHLASIRYEAMLDGKNISSSVKNGKLLLEAAGNYKIKVTVTDGGGNYSFITSDFTVGGSEPKGCKSSVMPFGLTGLAAAGFALAKIITRRRENRQ